MRIKLCVLLLVFSAQVQAEEPRAQTDGVDAMGTNIVSEVPSPKRTHIEPPKSDGVENMVGTDLLLHPDRFESPGLKKIMEGYPRKAANQKIVKTVAAQPAQVQAEEPRAQTDGIDAMDTSAYFSKVISRLQHQIDQAESDLRKTMVERPLLDAPTPVVTNNDSLKARIRSWYQRYGSALTIVVLFLALVVMYVLYLHLLFHYQEKIDRIADEYQKQIDALKSRLVAADK